MSGVAMSAFHPLRTLGTPLSCIQLGVGEWMISLLILIAALLITTAFYIWRRSSLPQARAEKFAFICLYCLTLALALRFGGRTYPGLHFPGSPLLNSLLNGNDLFVGVGYMAVLVAGAADTLLVFTRPSGRRNAEVLKGARWLAVGLAATIALYGFAWAAIMQRLP
jgi:hypothetical protein